MDWVKLSLILLGSYLDGGFGSNPAQFPGSPGYEVEYMPSIRTGYTCEEEDLHVQCDKGQVIQIVRANYGRFSIALCNDDGQTHWSVNCMAPNTMNILQKKCDNLNSCQVPVSSNLFSDPCPGTRKYLEIHYICSTTEPTRQTSLPHWLRQNNNNSSSSSSLTQPKNEVWLQKQHKEKDIKPVSNPSRNYNSRIPILVATTTSTPKRIPITTPLPTTTSTTTTSTTLLPAAKDDDDSTPASRIEVKVPDVVVETVSSEGPGINEELWMPPLEPEMDVLPPELLSDYCPSTMSRNLVWKYTRRGSNVVQPCPNGATGLARWSCARSNPYTGNQAEFSSSSNGPAAQWDTPQPDMSDCKSAAITNLEVKLRQSDPENVIASSLAQLTGSRKLYGGDLESAAGVMKTVANRIQYLLQKKTEKFYKKEAYIQEILLNIVRSGSNLLDVRNREAWSDLDDAQRVKIAGSLLQAMDNNALIFSGVTNQPEVLMESSYNILMAISVLHTRIVRNGTLLPTNRYEEPFGSIEDSVYLPADLLRQHSRDGLVKILFFSYKHLDEIISPFFPPRFHKLLNSRVVSVGLEGRRGVASLAEPVRVSLKHLREEGTGRPTCLAWDPDTSDWSARSCAVLETSRERTVCACRTLSRYALLMEEEAITTVVQLPDFNVEIIAASVSVGVILILLIVALKWRSQVHKVLLSPCSRKEKKSLNTLDTCSKSQSFFTGINIVKGGNEKTQTLSTTLPEQARLSQYMLSNGTLPPGAGVPGTSPAHYEGFEGYAHATLPVGRAQYPVPNTHITLNPYSTQLVDNINRMMKGSRGDQAPVNHIYQVAMSPQQLSQQLAMSPQLSQLTNTLKKKKCLGGHPGPCHHRVSGTTTTESSVHSDSGTTQADLETEAELLPNSSDVVFRAVSPHGHVYWEIDPKRPSKLVDHSDSDTNNDMHNMSDFSEEDGRMLKSSSRFSDNRPLISAGQMSLQLQQQAGAGGGSPALGLAPHHPDNPVSLIQFSPQRFNSLHRAEADSTFTGSTRSRLRQQARMKGAGAGMDTTVVVQDDCIPEQVQQQVQIPDLRRIPVSVKSSEYIMAKIQSHMDQRKQVGGGQTPTSEREV